MYMKELSNDEFDIFTKAFPSNSVFQTKEYAFVMSNQGYKTKFIGLIDNNKIIAASLILLEKHHGYYYAYAPRGFLINYNDLNITHIFNQEMKKFLGEKGVAAVKLSPMIIKNAYDGSKNKFYCNNNYNDIYSSIMSDPDYHHYGYNNYFEAQRPRFEAIIDLSKNNLYDSLSKNHKAKIKKAYENGIHIEVGDKDDIKLLYEQVKNRYPRDLKYLIDLYNYFNFNDNADLYIAKIDTKKHLINRQSKYNSAQQSVQNINYKIIQSNNSSKLINLKLDIDYKLETSRIKLIKATEMIKDYPDGIVLAFALVIKNNNQAHIIIDSYNSEYKFLDAKYLLIWELIKKYKNENIKILNLGGVSNILIEQNKYSGLIDFKAGFGATFIEYMGDLEVITNKTLYLLHNNPIKQLIKRKSA
ncbi:MAG: aminoacyltransferase [Clostridium sp.]|nr:aminoacyltransferase [Clostridium sp.]